MAFKSELQGVNEWIFSKISANSVVADFVGFHPRFTTTRQIYFNQAPEGARVPYCVFTYLSGVNVNGSSGRKVFKKMKYSVQLVSAGDSLRNVFNPLAHIDTMFQNDQMTDDVVVMGSHVLNDFSFTDVLDGGVNVRRNGFMISVSAYPQNPDAI